MNRTVLSAAWIAAACCFAHPASAADKAGCKDPSWASARIPGYDIDSCEERGWTSEDYFLAAGRTTLEGKRSTVVYALVDPAKNVADKTAWQHFVDLGLKQGGKLITDSRGGAQGGVYRKNAQGEFYWFYTHGSGNAENTGSYTLTTLQIIPLPQEVKAKVADEAWDTQSTPCKDPPWLVKQFSYEKLAGCTNRDFDSVILNLYEGPKTVAGRVLEHHYVLTDESKSPTTVAVYQNFVNALKGLGAKQVSDPRKKNQAVFTQKTPGGEYWYWWQQSGGNDDNAGSYELISVQVGGPPSKACTVELYGVNFDFNKATLRPDSEPVLNEVLASFQKDTTYAAEIGGHTDNVGEPAYNLKLSGERADAVKAWLTGHGVAGSRLTTAGFGDTKPLVPNTTDENRARNRRVELKRTGCK